jgi:ssDNA thymidine ADP-ribosyltransferase, DarT
MMRELLNPVKSRIFRIVHRDNLPWILEHGIHCPSSPQVNKNYVNIGNLDLIEKRKTREVKEPPYGSLSDYVPFYFTPFSPMALNIKTGFNCIRQRPSNEILILVSSIHLLQQKKLHFLFTDRHAYLNAAVFYSKTDDLEKIDWPLLQSKDFKRDTEDLGKLERYQAEALVHKVCPVSALRGIACYDNDSLSILQRTVASFNLQTSVAAKPEWYF